MVRLLTDGTLLVIPYTKFRMSYSCGVSETKKLKSVNYSLTFIFVWVWNVVLFWEKTYIEGT